MINLKQYFRKWFKKSPKDPMEIWRDSRYVINYAFTAVGIDYYTFDDLVNTPYDRALTAIDFFRELGMNCDKDYLQKHTAAIEELLMKTKIDVYSIKKLNDQMKERLNLIHSPTLIYKLASVVYFDKNENPTVYDAKYNLNKIVSWKKEFPDGSFFLLEPIKTFAPFLAEPQVNLKSYVQVWDQIETLHLGNLLSDASARISQRETTKTGM